MDNDQPAASDDANSDTPDLEPAVVADATPPSDPWPVALPDVAPPLPVQQSSTFPVASATPGFTNPPPTVPPAYTTPQNTELVAPSVRLAPATEPRRRRPYGWIAAGVLAVTTAPTTSSTPQQHEQQGSGRRAGASRVIDVGVDDCENLGRGQHALAEKPTWSVPGWK